MLPLVTSLRSAARTRYAAQASSALVRYAASQSHSRTDAGFSSWPQFVAAASLAALALNLIPVSYGDASDCDNVSEEDRRRQFNEWMAGNGADWTAAGVQPCKDSNAGLGLFATAELRRHMSHSWLGRRLGALILPGVKNQTVQVASVPLDLALTAQAARSDPDYGEYFSELMNKGVLDERNAIIVWLMFEKLKGADSRFAPYIQLLPESFDTPLWFSKEQLSELSGTTLAAATAARAASIKKTWQLLWPNMLDQVGGVASTLNDFKWASSVFWSRGLGLPIPEQSDDGVLRISTQEGLVPGLDFANHSQEARCWWEVVQQKQQQLPPKQQQPFNTSSSNNNNSNSSSSSNQSEMTSGSNYVITIMTNRACCPKPGEQLQISYGDKGNEELMLLYGFALRDNPSETVMVLCPVPPPGEWDQVFTARMHLLQSLNLKPQIFLSASHLANYHRAAVEATGKAPSGSRSGSSIVPAAARKVLEIFVMQEKELSAAVQQAQQQQVQLRQRTLNLSKAPETSAAPAAMSNSSTGSSNGSGSSSSSDSSEARLELLGLNMAVLTTFVRLLELKMVQMEGDEGTGSLEDDMRQLEETDAIQAAHQQHGQHAAAAAEMPAWLQNCLIYRIGQKQLVRGYLAAARRELQETFTELQASMDSRGETVE